MKKSFFLLAGVVFFWIFCSEYNPFDDPSNVDMVIIGQKSSIHADSIIAIFTTESLTVAAQVKENIDSFTITAEGNRYWEDTSIAAPVSAGEYTFRFSYPDTGDIKITLNTYRDNGDVIPKEFSLSVGSPLAQNDIIVEGGTLFTLSTPSVGGNDVVYNWQFQKQGGQQLIISYPYSSYDVQIDEPLSEETGFLWVEDSLGNQSPEVTFNYYFVDTTGPVIFCTNEGVVGDTVITGSRSFTFKIECHDIGGVGGALINSSPFDDSSTTSSNVSYKVYYKIFHNMDTVSTSITANIQAWDKDNNINTKTYYIKYDENGPLEIIVIKFPPSSPYKTAIDTYNVIAAISNPLDESVVVGVNHVDLGINLYIDTLSANTEEDVLYTASLQTGFNTIVVYVLELDSLTNTLDKDTAILDYSISTVDTTPPYIDWVKVNGNEGNKHYIPGNTAILELKAYEENMSSVIINGKSKTEDETYLWRDTLALTGNPQSFIIQLIDASNNQTKDTVWVQRNYIPEISPPVSLPKTLIIGNPWSIIFNVTDADGDIIDVKHQPGVGGELPDTNSLFLRKMTLNRWQIHWTGIAVSNNVINKSYITEIELSDGKQKNKYPWDFSIKDSTQAVSYTFKMLLPDSVDTTEEGALDLSKIAEPVDITCILEADAKPLTESDTIAIVQPDQTVKFPADAGDLCEFSLTFNPKEKKENELMIIIVIDSTGYNTIVDSVYIIYKYGFPHGIDSLGFLLQSDTGTIVEEGFLVGWHGLSISIAANANTNDEYDTLTMPRLLPDVLYDYPAVLFTPENHSNLLGNIKEWAKGSFTIFFVARHEPSRPPDTTSILISAGAAQYLGFGVFSGKMGITGHITNISGIQVDTTLTCDLKVMNNRWHILCFSTRNGLGSDHVELKMWVDGYSGPNSSLSFPSVSSGVDLNYLMLGGGGKHLALKNWNGEMVEVLKYSKYLSEGERDAVTRYLASRYKIHISD